MVQTENHSSFVEPSRVRVLVVPVGKWRRSQFIESVKKLRSYSEIRLLDITPIESSLFTPQGFPQGRLFFEFLTSGIDDSMDLFLYDFEPFRKTFVVIGLVNDASDPVENLKVLKEKYSTVISHNLIYTSHLIHSNLNVFASPDLVDGLETIACDIGKNFLLALNHYYSSYKHVTLRSPGAIGGNSVLKTSLTGQNMGSKTVFSTGNVASKRLSSIEMTTNNIKRSASIKLSKSLTASENRTQQRSQGRQLKILGNFQLLSGRYMDALHSFTDAVALLHKIKDYLWLGSALDGIAICFLLLTYLHVPFQIPQIVNFLCPTQLQHGAADTNSPRNSVNYTPMGSPRDSSSSTISVAVMDAEHVNLSILIRIISEKVLYYYELSLSDITDYAPQIIYSELLLKTLTFMVACHTSSELAPGVLKLAIDGKLPHGEEIANISKEPIFSKIDIYCFANKLFELQLKEMNIESQARIYVVLAQVYDSLGFVRKKAFVLRLLMVALVSNPLENTWYSDYKTLFGDMLELYGINIDSSEKPCPDSLDPSWLTLQKRCLQLCLTVTEKVNDSEYAATLAVLLIKKYTHLLTRIEQQILMKNFIKPLITSGHIKKYWDPFFLREIRLARLEAESSTSERDGIPIESEINLFEKSKIKSPSIDTHEVFNPFKQLKPSQNFDGPHSNISQTTFLVRDRGVISCMVQNPFKFEIDITEVQFNSTTLEFCELSKNDINSKTPFIIAPESIRMINLPIELKSSTNHKWRELSSLKVSILGLPLQEFSIKLPKNEHEGQHGGLERANAEKVELKVLPEQPELQFLRTERIPDCSLMMLHGTKKRLLVTLRNKSLSCPIDYLRFSHLTNVEKSMKPDYWKKLPLDDVYVMDKQLDWLQNSCITIINAPTRISPNETVTIEIEIDATSVPFQFSSFDLFVEYGMISKDNVCVYLKKLSLPFKITLRRSLEVPNVELVPLHELPSVTTNNVDWIEFIMNIKDNDTDFRVDDYILLLIDIRNSWLEGLSTQVTYENFTTKAHLVEGQHTTRIIVPLKKFRPGETDFRTRPIPKLCHGRQYLSSGLQIEQESEMREKFWCREHILSRLKCSWSLSANSSITGIVDFSQFMDKFDSRMVSIMCNTASFCHISLSIDKKETVRGQKIQAEISVEPSTLTKSNASTKAAKTHVSKKSKIQILTLNIMVFDTKTSKLLPKSNRRILYNGTLSRQISATKQTTANIELLPIEKGDYEIIACISKGTDDNQNIRQSNFEQASFIVT